MDETDDIAREDQPPRPGPTMTIVRVKTRENQVFTICSPTWWGVFIHWIANRSARCRAQRTLCQWCKKQAPRKWKGYLHCVADESGKEVFVEFTPRSAMLLDNQLGRGVNKRGYRIALARSSDGNNGRLQVRLLSRTPNDSNLPDPKDPEKVLRFLWGEDVDLEDPTW